ncbi:hypothetical protein CFHF_02200 [Caulobacter flavus]|uniref:DUF6265 domain-containing protein n=1 Tax=Caulobacter flavus TaxID=1679497 RepID=A0A2N5D3A8_9CAUL|nr:DUF6265 family protein [Caulobacter flavus]AYV48992.1 hypothetical protein C1707_23555 [Caulobacter flavus]PLR20560.1 hypothetical protein CFHF_02200 [Caulobacter flavus]
MLALLFALQAAPAAPAIDQAAFLAGCWRQERPNGVVEEQWLAPGGGMMLGMGRTVRDGAARSYEFTRIQEADGRLTFFAIPSGQPAAAFPLKSAAPGELVFENPAHDFPQRVIYKSQGENGLLGRIEGEIGGKARSVDFPYKRCSGAD